MILSGQLKFDETIVKPLSFLLDHEIPVKGSPSNVTKIKIGKKIYEIRFSTSENMSFLYFSLGPILEEDQSEVLESCPFLLETKSFQEQATIIETWEMDLDYPLRNFCYNMTRILYSKILSGTESELTTLSILEDLLQRYMHSLKKFASVLEFYFFQTLSIEKKKVLTWNEKKLLIQRLKERKKEIWSTFKRIHTSHALVLSYVFIKINLHFYLKRLIQSPREHLWDVIKKNSIDKIVWFFKTVRNNLGYSVALAVYGPFTYYFITMPMNPHAMQAVGKVREKYIEVKNRLTSSEVEPETREMTLKKKEFPKWEARMGHFKQMQISYEENLDFATRMGRLEQLETQFNFPLQVESTWNQVIHYEEAIREKVKNAKDPKLLSELKLVSDVKVYLWERFSQYLSDQIYIMLDVDHEHRQSNYYTGHAFIFMRDMTQHLKKEMGPTFDVSIRDRVMALARFYQDTRIEQHNIIRNIESNSAIFSAKNLFESHQFRNVMKRQWELLYLQNSKAEEAANNGLNMYQWSIRNTVWILQTIFSLKENELSLLVNNNKTLRTNEIEQIKKNSLTLELLFHNLLLEYSGIQNELKDHLKGDHEIQSRKLLLNEIKDSLISREGHFNQSHQVPHKTASFK